MPSICSACCTFYIYSSNDCQTRSRIFCCCASFHLYVSKANLPLSLVPASKRHSPPSSATATTVESPKQTAAAGRVVGARVEIGRLTRAPPTYASRFSPEVAKTKISLARSQILKTYTQQGVSKYATKVGVGVTGVAGVYRLSIQSGFFLLYLLLFSSVALLLLILVQRRARARGECCGALATQKQVRLFLFLPLWAAFSTAEISQQRQQQLPISLAYALPTYSRNIGKLPEPRYVYLSCKRRQATKCKDECKFSVIRDCSLHSPTPDAPLHTDCLTVTGSNCHSSFLVYQPHASAGAAASAAAASSSCIPFISYNNIIQLPVAVNTATAASVAASPCTVASAASVAQLIAEAAVLGDVLTSPAAAAARARTSAAIAPAPVTAHFAVAAAQDSATVSAAQTAFQSSWCCSWKKSLHAAATMKERAALRCTGESKKLQQLRLQTSHSAKNFLSCAATAPQSSLDSNTKKNTLTLMKGQLQKKHQGRQPCPQQEQQKQQQILFRVKCQKSADSASNKAEQKNVSSSCLHEISAESAHYLHQLSEKGKFFPTSQSLPDSGNCTTALAPLSTMPAAAISPATAAEEEMGSSEATGVVAAESASLTAAQGASTANKEEEEEEKQRDEVWPMRKKKRLRRIVDGDSGFCATDAAVSAAGPLGTARGAERGKQHARTSREGHENPDETGELASPEEAESIFSGDSDTVDSIQSELSSSEDSLDARHKDTKLHKRKCLATSAAGRRALERVRRLQIAKKHQTLQQKKEHPPTQQEEPSRTVSKRLAEKPQVHAHHVLLDHPPPLFSEEDEVSVAPATVVKRETRQLTLSLVSSQRPNKKGPEEDGDVVKAAAVVTVAAVKKQQQRDAAAAATEGNREGGLGSGRSRKAKVETEEPKTGSLFACISSSSSSDMSSPFFDPALVDIKTISLSAGPTESKKTAVVHMAGSPRNSTNSVCPGRQAALQAAAAALPPSPPILFSVVSDTWQAIEETKRSGGAGSSRRQTVLLSNLFRLLLYYSPSLLINAVLLCLKQLAPAFHGLELGVGEALVLKALAETYARTEQQLKKELQQQEDLGSVAEQSSSRRRVLAQPERLTLKKVFSDLLAIAKASGKDSQLQKKRILQRLLVAAKPSEAKYIVRSVQQHLRTGASTATVYQALAYAFFLTKNARDGIAAISDTRRHLPIKEKSVAVEKTSSQEALTDTPETVAVAAETKKEPLLFKTAADEVAAGQKQKQSDLKERTAEKKTIVEAPETVEESGGANKSAACVAAENQNNNSSSEKSAEKACLKYSSTITSSSSSSNSHFDKKDGEGRSCNDSGVWTAGELEQGLARMEQVVRRALCEVCDIEVVVSKLLLGATAETLPLLCQVQPGVPMQPMLAKPSRGFSEVLERMKESKFTCEYKYDGERVQIHVLPAAAAPPFFTQANNSSTSKGLHAARAAVAAQNKKKQAAPAASRLFFSQKKAAATKATPTTSIAPATGGVTAKKFQTANSPGDDGLNQAEELQQQTSGLSLPSQTAKSNTAATKQQPAITSEEAPGPLPKHKTPSPAQPETTEIPSQKGNETATDTAQTGDGAVTNGKEVVVGAIKAEAADKGGKVEGSEETGGGRAEMKCEVAGTADLSFGSAGEGSATSFSTELNGALSGSVKASRVRLFSRNLEDATEKFPDVVEMLLPRLPATTNECILDGEIVAYDPLQCKILPFQTLTRRKRKSPTPNATRGAAPPAGSCSGKSSSAVNNFSEAKVAVFIFDCMQLNGRSLLSQTLEARRKFAAQAVNFATFPGSSNSEEQCQLLELQAQSGAAISSFKGAESSSPCTEQQQQQQEQKERGVQANSFEVENRIYQASHREVQDAQEFEEFLNEALDANCEGLMVKTLRENASYEPSKRSLNWLKVKKDYIEDLTDSVDLVPIGGFYGKGKRSGTFGTYLLAVYNPDAETYESVCRAATGFSEKALKQHQAHLSAHIIEKKKPYYQVSDKMEPDVWFEACQVWECRAADLSISPVHTAALGEKDPDKGIGLRFPRFLRVREDKLPEQATTRAQIVDLFESQFRRAKNAPSSSSGSVEAAAAAENEEEFQFRKEGGDQKVEEVGELEVDDCAADEDVSSGDELQ